MTAVEGASAARRFAGRTIDGAISAWWPLQRVVQRLRWARLRARSAVEARAVGSRVEVLVGRGATIGRGAQIEPLPGTRNRLVIGAGARIGDDLTVQFGGGTLIVGDGALVRSAVRITCTGSCSIGPRAYVSYGTLLHCSEELTLGPDAVLAEYVCVTDSAHVRTSLDVPCFHHVHSKPTAVGANVWLGAHSVVTHGVSIGDGAVVGAAAVVNVDVPPFWLAVGVPARLVRQLAAEEVAQP